MSAFGTKRTCVCAANVPTTTMFFVWSYERSLRPCRPRQVRRGAQFRSQCPPKVMIPRGYISPTISNALGVSKAPSSEDLSAAKCRDTPVHRSRTDPTEIVLNRISGLPYRVNVRTSP